MNALDDEAPTEVHDMSAMRRELRRRQHDDREATALFAPAPADALPPWVATPRSPGNYRETDAPRSLGAAEPRESQVRLSPPPLLRSWYGYAVDRIWHDAEAVPALADKWRPLLEKREAPAATGASAFERAATLAVETILSDEMPLSTDAVWPLAREAAGRGGGIFPRELLLVEGEMMPCYHPIERLKAMLAACSHLALRHPVVGESVEAIDGVMQRPYLSTSRSLVAKISAELRAVVDALDDEAASEELEAHVTRTLVDGRHFDERLAFGRAHIPVEVRSLGADHTLVGYLPLPAAVTLPTLRRWTARLVAELRPPASDRDGRVALRVVALGRVVEL